MSNRQGVIGSARVDVEPIPSPNRYIPRVTAEVRVFWPPNATYEEILGALYAAGRDARREVRYAMKERLTHGNP